MDRRCGLRNRQALPQALMGIHMDGGVTPSGQRGRNMAYSRSLSGASVGCPTFAGTGQMNKDTWLEQAIAATHRDSWDISWSGQGQQPSSEEPQKGVVDPCYIDSLGRVYTGRRHQRERPLACSWYKAYAHINRLVRRAAKTLLRNEAIRDASEASRFSRRSPRVQGGIN